MADAGLGARRDCEEMIVAGRVQVNGRIVQTLPCFVEPASDVVALDGEVIELPVPEESADSGTTTAASKARAFIYVLINKP
ncbi:MAG TPA: S4 domain-containing protein, partial [Steroidobacter sp.]|nr:S4 domain-containing protein [Steroidobacter sp.]